MFLTYFRIGAVPHKMTLGGGYGGVSARGDDVLDARDGCEHRSLAGVVRRGSRIGENRQRLELLGYSLDRLTRC